MELVFGSLALPIIMIVSGYFMMKREWPKNPNLTRGHRTPMSKKNQDTWRFAHRYSGKFDLTFGLIAIIPSVVVGILAERGTLQVWTVGALIVTQLGVIILGIILTESALKRVFDEHGNRRV